MMNARLGKIIRLDRMPGNEVHYRGNVYLCKQKMTNMVGGLVVLARFGRVLHLLGILLNSTDSY